MPNSITIPLTPTTPPAQSVAVTPHTNRTVAADALSWLKDWLGAKDISGDGDRVAKRALLSASRLLADAANWTYLYQHGRIQINAHYVTGTVQLQLTSGPQPNYVTLTGGTWPAWAANGCLRIGTVVYDVLAVIDSTHLILDPNFTAIADQPAGSAYDLYQDAYTLPEDLIAVDKIQPDTIWAGMEYVHPSAWLETVRSMQSLSNTPRWFTIMGDPKIPGRLCIRLFPYPDTTKTLDFIYKRRMRVLKTFNYATGQVTIDAVNTPTTVTGVSTVWTGDMVGTVLRVSSTTQPPTGTEGVNPFYFERNVKAVISATQLTLDDVAPASVTKTAYLLSDPIDVEDTSMLEAFFRCAEWQASIGRKQKESSMAYTDWIKALMKAREADARFMGQRIAGVGGPFRQRLARMPSGPDVP